MYHGRRPKIMPLKHQNYSFSKFLSQNPKLFSTPHQMSKLQTPRFTTKEPKKKINLSKREDEFSANSTKNLTKNKDFFHVGIFVTAKKRGPKCLSSTDPLFFYAEFLK